MGIKFSGRISSDFECVYMYHLYVSCAILTALEKSFTPPTRANIVCERAHYIGIETIVL